MNKRNSIIIGVIVAVFLLGIGAFFFTKHEDKKEVAEITSSVKSSAKEMKSEYDELKIGGNVNDVNKKLGSPLYTEASTDSSGNAATVYTWGSNKSGELGAKLIVSAENNTIVEKAVSGIYVPYNKNKVVSASKFENIQLNKEFTTKKAIQEFGEPNAISEYKNINGKTTQTYTWETNTTGPVGSYFTVIFTSDVATSKNEVGLT